MRNFTFNQSKFFRLIFLVFSLLFINYNASAQFFTKHYIAPAPWQYFSRANEIVIATNSTSPVTFTITKSDGSAVSLTKDGTTISSSSLTTVKGAPAVYRFVGDPNTAALTYNSAGTVYNDRGIIVTSTTNGGAISVNLRNIASDAIGQGGDSHIKGNASLTSFGDAGIGVEFRVGYYRNVGSTDQDKPFYSVMAINNNTQVKLNGSVITTLGAGQSYLFNAAIGSLVESSGPVVMNTGVRIDTPLACGDGTFDQLPPTSVLGKEYFLERGKGNDVAEQTTIVATRDNTVVTINTYNATNGNEVGTPVTVNLNAGGFHTFQNGIAGTQLSASRIVANNNVAVYSGTADKCEVDVSTIAPVSACGGSVFVETSTFKGYNNASLDYFGYVLLQSQTATVFLNSANLETTMQTTRRQLGNTGWYIIDFNRDKIGNPNTISLNSSAKLTVSIAQQGDGYSMAAFFSNFAQQPSAPKETYIGVAGCLKQSATLTTDPGFAPYVWRYNGTVISGQVLNSITVTKTGTYTVTSTLSCGVSSQSTPITVTLCSDVAVENKVNVSSQCVGSNVVFTVTAKNLGPSNAEGVSVTDKLPSGYTYVSSVAPTGTTYDSSTGVWTISGLDSGASAVLTITGTVKDSGTYTNTATITSSNVDDPTGNNTATATVTANALPVAATLSTNSPVCSGSNAIFTISGTQGNVVTYTGAASGTTTIGTDGKATVTISNVTANSTLNLTNVSNGTCNRALSVTGTVMVNPLPAAPSISAGGATTFCSGGSVVLTSSASSGHQWYKDGVAITGETNKTYAATATGSYTVTTNNGTCTSAQSASLSVTVNPTPSAPTVAAQTFCSSENKTIADLASLGASYKWYSASTGGSALAGTTVLATGTYYVSQTSSGCESTRASVSVTVNATPSAPTVAAQTFCSSENKTIADLASLGASYKWYSASTGGSALAGTTVLATGTYYVSQSSNGCESTRASVSVTITTNPVKPILGSINQPTCSIFTGNFTITNYNSSYTYTISPNGATLNKATGVVTATKGIYKVTATLNSCASEISDEVGINSILCANADPFGTKTSGATTVTVGNVKTNDTLNGVAVTADNTTVTPKTDGVLSVDAAGVVTLAANAPSGSYSIEYTICELNTTNCKTATATVDVVNGLVANADPFGTKTSGATAVTVGNVKTNDTLNGVAVTADNTTVTPKTDGVLSVDAAGVVTLAANAPSGSYSIVYQICELNTTNCKTATATVDVANTLVANADPFGTKTSGATAVTVGNVKTNDTLNGVAVTADNTTVTPKTDGVLSVDAAGVVTLVANAPSGSYSIVYQICELNATNCKTATATVDVANTLVANADPFGTKTSGATAVTVGNVKTNDTLNGVAVTADNTTVTPKTEGVLSVDAAGVVTLAANAPSGSYSIVYQICELNTTNCKTATATVDVVNEIKAVKETTTAINGSIGGTTIALTTNDTLNENPVSIGSNSGQVSISIVGTLPTGLTLNANGTITVAPNTPAANYNVEYTICEVGANPVNCSSVISVIPVTAGDLVANPDTVASVTGSNIPQTLGVNVLDNDTKNGVKLNPADVILTESTPDPKGYLVLNPDGTVTLGANAPAGDYELTYTICEKLNTDNCKSNTVTVTVKAPTIDAVTETTVSINGNTGGTTASLTTNDTLDGKSFVVGTNPGEVTISIVGTLPTGLTLNANGTITVAPNTPKGNYNVEYRICDNNNSGNCDTVTSVVPVTAGDLVANPDTVASVTGSNTPQTLGVNVLDNDTKNGVKLNPADVILTESTPDPKGYLVLNPDGTVTLGANAPAGDYELTYTICEKLNTDNCKSNTVKVTVKAPVIDAVGETLSPSINGSIGGTTADSVIGNDTLNGSPVVIGTLAGQVKLTAVNVPAGLTLNADGTVTVAENTPSGVYDVAYRICEITNPSNCDDAISKVAVNNGVLVANSDDIPSVTPSNTGKNLGVNIFTNDTKNGQPLSPSDVTLTVSKPDSKGYLTVDSDGNVTLGANAPVGDYELTYTICEKLNPDNCSSNTVRVTVNTLIIDAVGETLTPSIIGSIGGTTTSSVIENDTLNGSPAVIGTLDGQVKLTPINVPAGLTLNANGTVTVAVNTPSGIYNVEYSICENTNPSNCDTAISKVAVNNGTLIANADTIPSVKVSNTTQNLGVNIFTNDTKNGTALNPSDVNLTISMPDPKGYLTVNPDGTVSLGANAPAGDYELTYTICEKLNSDNCSSNTVRITVESNLVANLDSVPSAVGINTPQTLINVFANDTKDGNALVPSDVILTTTVPDSKGYLTLDANGNAILAPNAPAGDYELTYSICDKLNTSNCSTNVVKVTVKAPILNTIIANNDEDGPIDVKKGMNATINIFANDLLNGVRPNASDVVLTTVVTNPNVTLNADGTVSIAPNTPNGVYNVTYQICEAANTSNCSQSALVKVTVVNSVDPTNPEPPAPNKITLVDDTNISVDGINGDLEFVNVLANDLINGQPINPADVIVKPLTTDNYFEWNADGTVSVKPNTLGKTYTITYQVCEKADPSNCSTAVLTVFVEVPAIAVIKTATLNDENKDGFANAGETITYKFTVTNTGNVPLTGITINDPLPGVVVSGQAIDLAVNASNETNFIAVYKITQDDINKKSVTNQAIAKGSSVRGVVVEDKSDDSTNSGDNPTVINLDGCTIEVLKAFSPNGDGKNERFYIRGIECYPDNTVEIYNRWGVLVFSIDQYNNNDKAFRGYSNGRSTIKQTEGLPVGTYFYILKYKDNANAPQQKSGYLYINK